MIKSLPFYIYLTFFIALAYVLIMFYRSGPKTKKLIGAFIFWGIFQSILAILGFYEKTMTFPPRMLVLMFPIIIIIFGSIFSPKMNQWLVSLDLKQLTWVHVVRIPVEFVLLWLFIYAYVPELMTFEGRNFDILAGLTAPLIIWLGFRKGILNKPLLWIWNILSIILLANIMLTATLSVPTVLQQFGFDQPNMAVIKFPFILLPGIIVPLVLISNIAAFVILKRK